MSAQTDRLNEVIALAEGHQRRLLEALRDLELDIIALLRGAPLRDGQLFDLEWAIQARTQIRQAIDARYLNLVDSLVSEYAEVAEEAQALLGRYSQFINLNQGVLQQLQQLTFDGYSALGDEFLEAVSKQIYEATLTGQPFADAVRIVQNSVQSDLARYARQAVHDGLMDFDRAINVNMALDAGAERFVYIGPDDDVTRPHCDKFVGRTLTVDEINKAWEGSWAGKREGSPFVVAGGFNCRHHWSPTFE
jgi:hypothetical protein